MKDLYKLIVLLMMLLSAWSCEEDDNMDPVGEWEISTATPLTPAPNAEVILEDAAPDAVVRFDWQPAVTTNRFLIGYTFVLDSAGNADFSTPILSLPSGNAGKDLFVKPTAQQIDYALSAAGYPAGSTVALKWGIIAKAIEKETVATQNISIQRFATDPMPATLYITGSGTEAGTAVTEAIAMRARKDADGNNTNVFDVYTKLTQGGTYFFRDQAALPSLRYGGKDGAIVKNGIAIAAPETAVYRVTVDFNQHTYELLKLDKWSIVGGAITGGWGGDEPMEYKGLGLWERKIELTTPGTPTTIIFRANGDWGYILKRIKGRPTNVLMESEAAEVGVEVEDVPVTEAGMYTVTLNLAADQYTYSLVLEDPVDPPKAIIGDTANPETDVVSGTFSFGSYTVPERLFLLTGGTVVAELTKTDKVFTSGKYLALEQNKTYVLNDAADGSGTTYNDNGDGSLGVARDQAYQLTVNFETGKLSWKYYNIKLFHWDDAGGGWDARNEFLMTYVHPYKFEVTQALKAGYDMKFNSPWEVEMGADNPSALAGTMTNKGGSNFKCITQNGTYKATITVADDYSKGTYSFVKQ